MLPNTLLDPLKLLLLANPSLELNPWLEAKQLFKEDNGKSLEDNNYSKLQSQLQLPLLLFNHQLSSNQDNLFKEDNGKSPEDKLLLPLPFNQDKSFNNNQDFK